MYGVYIYMVKSEKWEVLFLPWCPAALLLILLTRRAAHRTHHCWWKEGGGGLWLSCFLISGMEWHMTCSHVWTGSIHSSQCSMFDVVYYITHGKRKEERVRYGMVWYGSMVWYGTVRKHALLWWKWKTELQRFKKENVLYDAQCWRLGLGYDAPGIPACVIVDFGRWAVSRRYHIRIQEDRIVFYEGGEGCEGWVHIPYLFIQKRNNGRQLMDELHTDTQITKK